MLDDLRKYLGLRNWLYFTKVCTAPDEYLTLCRVDTVTLDVEYLDERLGVRYGELVEWRHVVPGRMLTTEGGDPIRNYWICEMLDSFYG